MAYLWRRGGFSGDPVKLCGVDSWACLLGLDPDCLRVAVTIYGFQCKHAADAVSINNIAKYPLLYVVIPFCVISQFSIVIIENGITT